MRRKVVFGNFRYRECDNLALYLEKMAREGWIFRDWRLGMVFEKEEPQKLEYAVEVFSEGNEMTQNRNLKQRSLPYTAGKPAGSW